MNNVQGSQKHMIKRLLRFPLIKKRRSGQFFVKSINKTQQKNQAFVFSVKVKPSQARVSKDIN